ncbi:MAG: DUF885 domain-containing protein [Candidatus Polarisedimenticolia bacterium]
MRRGLAVMLLMLGVPDPGSAASTRGPSDGAAGGFAVAYEALRTNREGLDEGTRLRRLFDLAWRESMTEFPEFATNVGFPGQGDRWTDRSLEAIERRKRDLERPAAVLRSIRREVLGEEERLSHDLFSRSLEEAQEARRFPSDLMPVTQLSGVQQEAALVMAMAPAATLRDYRDLLARLERLPLAVDQTIVLMREGLRRGVTPPKVALRDVPGQVGNQIVEDPLRSPLLAPFTRIPGDLPGGERERLRADAVRIYRESVRPSFERLRDFLAGTYLAGAREGIALRDLPDGEAWYAFQVRRQTTTRLTPRQIHDLGLREIHRIRAAMEAVRKEAGYEGNLAAFIEFLRTDPRFFFTEAGALVKEYRDISKRIDPGLVRLFGRLPRLPYGVNPIPSFAEKSQTTAYYEQGSPDAGRPGIFFVNTYDLRARPKWEMEALTLHEAVPGHHLQIALAQELEGLPEFRRHTGPTAYVEGWALYAEGLGDDLGVYGDPYSRFGRLTYEMWRAIRLVVDTGMHALGWTRERSIAFFRDNAAKTDHDIIVEIDRYIVDPGQALAYKIGELKIRELRDEARRVLGERFDLRAFHDEILGQGALPLDLLEARVRSWIEVQRRGARARA